MILLLFTLAASAAAFVPRGAIAQVEVPGPVATVKRAGDG